MKTPRYDIKRGRHKKRASTETRQWEDTHLPAPMPAWMAEDTYQRLLKLRRAVDPWTGGQ